MLKKVFYSVILILLILTIFLAYIVFGHSKYESPNNATNIQELEDEIHNLSQQNKQLRIDLEESKLEVDELQKELISVQDDFSDTINQMNRRLK